MVQRPEKNRYLLRLLGKPEQDWPHFVADSSACFKVNLEKTLEDEIGREPFTKWLSEAQQEFGIDKKKDALKNPEILAYVIDRGCTERQDQRDTGAHRREDSYCP